MSLLLLEQQILFDCLFGLSPAIHSKVRTNYTLVPSIHGCTIVVTRHDLLVCGSQHGLDTFRKASSSVIDVARDLVWVQDSQILRLIVQV